MSTSLIPSDKGAKEQERPAPRAKQHGSVPEPLTLHSPLRPEASAARQAELFYLQKQIQAQTPMAVVLENGDRLDGVIEWYDRDSIKLRGRTRTLVYKSAIKYLHKLGDTGQE